MVEFEFGFRPGVLVTFLAIALGLLLIFLGWRDKQEQLRRRERRETTRKGIVDRAQAGLPPNGLGEMEVIWSEATRSMEQLQRQLKDNLRSLEGRLQDERQHVEMKAESLKALARANRLPLTLYELYEGMRHFHRKSEESRRSDLEWHAKIGVSQVDVVDVGADLPGQDIFFMVEGKPVLLRGRHHRYSRTSFVELSLVDEGDTVLVTVRVRPDGEGRQLLADAVMNMRPGDWIQTMLVCRAKMDVRAQEVNLLLGHADVERLKESFQISGTKD